MRFPVSSTTGIWRIRRSVMTVMSSATVELGEQVITSEVIKSRTRKPAISSNFPGIARTTSRSETMPSTFFPSGETTKAPTWWTSNALTKSWSVALPEMVSTRLPEIKAAIFTAVSFGQKGDARQEWPLFGQITRGGFRSARCAGIEEFDRYLLLYGWQ